MAMSSEFKDINSKTIKVILGLLKMYPLWVKKNELQFCVELQEHIDDIRHYLSKGHTLSEDDVTNIMEEVNKAETEISNIITEFATSYVNKYFLKHSDEPELMFDMELEDEAPPLPDEAPRLPEELNQWNQTVERYNQALLAVMQLKEVGFIHSAQQQLEELQKAKLALNEARHELNKDLADELPPYELPTYDLSTSLSGDSANRGKIIQQKKNETIKIIQEKINKYISGYVAKIRKQPMEDDVSVEIERLKGLINSAVKKDETQQEGLAARKNETTLKAEQDAETDIPGDQDQGSEKNDETPSNACENTSPRLNTDLNTSKQPMMKKTSQSVFGFFSHKPTPSFAVGVGLGIVTGAAAITLGSLLFVGAIAATPAVALGLTIGTGVLGVTALALTAKGIFSASKDTENSLTSVYLYP